jgi:hypothetical protein
MHEESAELLMLVQRLAGRATWSPWLSQAVAVRRRQPNTGANPVRRTARGDRPGNGTATRRD